MCPSEIVKYRVLVVGSNRPGDGDWRAFWRESRVALRFMLSPTGEEATVGDGDHILAGSCRVCRRPL